jgi:hypothetical protein
VSSIDFFSRLTDVFVERLNVRPATSAVNQPIPHAGKAGGVKWTGRLANDGAIP